VDQPPAALSSVTFDLYTVRWRLAQEPYQEPRRALRVLTRREPQAHARLRLLHQPVRRAGERHALERGEGQARAQPQPLVRRAFGLARERRALHQARLLPERALVERQTRELHALARSAGTSS
jgi:hypothetical protein